tara:strand:+ start:2405 stop:3166 length:762 start_codon:yes stop_codon:yes gene_type:complete
MKIKGNLSCILLLGGKGSRYSKLSETPKQLIKIYSKTLIENILIRMMNNGINDFIFPLGYKKKYFYNFFLKKKKIGSFKVNILISKKDRKQKNCINLKLFDAGKETSKLSRIKKSLAYIDTDVFFVTYGDGVSNINLSKIYKLYVKTKKLVISCTKMKSQYGHLQVNKNKLVNSFSEKPILPMPVNIGYYLFTKRLFNKYYSRKYELETSFLNRIIKKKILISYLHKGYFFNIDKKIDLLKIKKEYKKIINLF